MIPTLRVVSLGAGVQSSTLVLMAKAGLVTPIPDCAIFADTGWEPAKVYEHLDWLESELPFPVYRVSAGDLREDLLNGVNSTGHPFQSVPLFSRHPNGKVLMTQRQCTREYKIAPIETKIRRLLGIEYRKHVKKDMLVENWLGISIDEVSRVKPNKNKWIQNRWPLVEQNISRSDCSRWFEEHYPGRDLPRSACIGCPFHSEIEWDMIKRKDPISWADVVSVDEALRLSANRIEGEPLRYLHRSCTPLKNVVFTPTKQNDNTFNEECEGMCGV